MVHIVQTFKDLDCHHIHSSTYFTGTLSRSSNTQALSKRYISFQWSHPFIAADIENISDISVCVCQSLCIQKRAEFISQATVGPTRMVVNPLKGSLTLWACASRPKSYVYTTKVGEPLVALFIPSISLAIFPKCTWHRCAALRAAAETELAGSSSASSTGTRSFSKSPYRNKNKNVSENTCACVITKIMKLT